jgi:pilus assembly protein TadC
VVDLTTQALAVGGLAGVGVALLAAGLLPAGPPDLRAALARLDTPPALTDHPAAGAGRPGGGWWARLGAWLAARTPAPLAAPATDLRLLGVDPARFAAVRAAVAVVGLAIPGGLWALAGLAGLWAPITIPAAVGLGLAVAGWLTPAAVLARRAAAARAGLRVALSAYLDLVALERAGAGSPVEALEAAAAVGHGPAFTLIRSRLALAARSGTSPYAALADLAQEVGVAELRDLADIAATAADGAAVYASLLAKARSLRNAASERLVFPVVLIGTGFLLLVFYPALARLLTSG